VIVRILGEGQREVPDGEMAAIDDLDTALQHAVDTEDEAAFEQALHELLGLVRRAGTAVPPETLVPSDLVLPSPDASLAEVREMLTGEGLTQGMDR
jgi:hypothetical protein